jgi:nitrogen fixation NifU-like protein
MLYSTQVWDHFRQPRHAGEWPEDAAVSTGTADTPGSKAVLRLQLRCRDREVEAARFLAYGCPSTIAAGSWLCDWLQGRRVEEAARLTAMEVAEALALPASRRHCAVLAVDALKAALAGWQV